MHLNRPRSLLHLYDIFFSPFPFRKSLGKVSNKISSTMNPFMSFSFLSTCFRFLIVTFVKTSFCKELQVLPVDEKDQRLITPKLQLVNIFKTFTYEQPQGFLIF
jgi:hypothetical protein